MKKVSCIICAYNESERILDVLKALQNHPHVDEIIVVDDASADGTASVLAAFKSVKKILLKKNGGKTHALTLGIEKAKNPWLLLLDADLRGLRASDVTALLKPIMEGKAVMSMSIRSNSYAIHKWMGLDFSSGERVFPKKWVQGKEKEMKKLPRFGFEVWLNQIFLASSGKLVTVAWKQVSHTRKSEKMGYWKGQWSELKMALDMVRTVGLLTIVRQNLKLLKRKRAV